MSTIEAEPIDIISNLGKTGQPIWGNCRVHLGDGTVVVTFENGRAKASPEVAKMLLGRSDMTVVDHAGVLRDAEAPTFRSPAESSQVASNPEADALREEARKALLAEGGDVPPFAIPAGFATHTAEEDHRCLAPKGDGTQCSNTAKDGGWACGLQPHAAAIAELTPA